MNRSKTAASALGGTAPFEEAVLPALRRVLASEIAVLETAVGVFQDAQALIPLPAKEELAGMRKGRQPLTKAAYLLGRLQQGIVALENIASDLRTDLEDGLECLDGVELSAEEFNAIEAARARLSP